MAAEGCGVIRGDVGIESLAKHPSGDVLHAFHLVLGGLGHGEDNGELVTLVCTIEVMDCLMEGV